VFSFLADKCESFNKKQARRTSRVAKSRLKPRLFEQLEVRQLMTAVPAFSSLPSADVTVYLDFDGHYESVAGNLYEPEKLLVFHDVTTPVFSRDDDADFSATELQMIEQIWKCVAEDYAPFNVNVTTVAPAEFEHGSGLRIAIGGSSLDWYGADSTGFGINGAYRNAVNPNTVYVFTDNFFGATPQYARKVADVASHESGHAFGLGHQQWKDANGTVISDYNPGDAEHAPLMGDSLHSQRSLWWKSTVGQFAEQNDIKTLVNSGNEITLRPDDHGDALATATPLTLESGPVAGLITLSQAMILDNQNVAPDVDAFVINLPENGLMKHWQVNVGVDGYSANFDAKLEVYRVEGKSMTLVGMSDSDFSLGAGLTFTGAGQYLIKVKSHGGFGDIGQYKLDVFQAADAPLSVERFTLPPLIDIVCDPLQPIEKPGLIVSRDLTAPIVTPITTKAGTSASVSPMLTKTVVTSVGRATNSVDEIALDLAFADLESGSQWTM
jgi:hypothetical protein